MSNALNKMAKFVKKNSPTILTVIGCVGVVTTAVITGKSAIKASKIIETKKKDYEENLKDFRGDDSEIDFTLKDKVKLTWKYFIPSVISGAGSIMCIIGANSMNLNRQSALAALYSSSQLIANEYKAKVVEKIGEKASEKIEGQVFEKKVENDIHEKPEKVPTCIIAGSGKYLCLESLTDTYFVSCRQDIMEVINQLNEGINLNGDCVTVDEYVYEISQKDSGQLGSLFEFVRPIKPRFDAIQHPETGEPVLVINYSEQPEPLV